MKIIQIVFVVVMLFGVVLVLDGNGWGAVIILSMIIGMAALAFSGKKKDSKKP